MDKKGLGERIQTVRGALNRDVFAEKTGVDKQTIGRYERDERVPDADFLLKLIEIFGCDPAWLLTGRAPSTYSPEFKAVLEKLKYIYEHDEDSWSAVKGKVIDEYRPLKKAEEEVPLSRTAGEKGGS